MSQGGKSSRAGSAQDYYGSIAGVAALGPLDFISGVVVDERLVWPPAPEWPAGTRAVSTRRITPQANQLSIQTQDPHGCVAGDFVALSNFPQAEMNAPFGKVIGANDAWGLQVAIPGLASGATVDYGEGWVARIAPISVNELRRTGAIVYQCVEAHQATPDTAPPNSRWWRQYRLSRTSPGTGNPLRLSESDPGPSAAPLIKLTVESHGELFVYWGTEDQLLDKTNENILAPLGHPPYRDQIVVVLKNFLFGRERATPPNVQIIGGRTPQQTVITGPPAQLDGGGQANPFCILAEWLTHPIWGIGFSPDQMEVASWQAAAEWAATDPDTLYLSPLIHRPQSVRQMVGDLLAHCDGWMRWNPEGRLEAGHWPHEEAPPVFDNGNTVDDEVAIEGHELGWNGDGWEGTTNQTVLIYADAAHGFKDRPAQAASSWNRIQRGRVASRTIQRPHVTRSAQAMALATRDAQINAEPLVSSAVTVHSDAIQVRPGDPLRLRQLLLGLECLARCTERTLAAPPSARLTLQVTSERGWTAASLRAILSPSSLPPAGGPSRPSPVNRFAFFMSPPSLAGGADFQVCFLAARNSGLTRRLHLWMRQADPDAFYELVTLTRFAVGGTVLAGLAPYLDSQGQPVTEDDTQGVSLQFDEQTPAADLDAIRPVPTVDASNDDAVLLVLMPMGNHNRYEICTVKSMATVASNHHRAILRRAGFGTLSGGDGSSSWAPGDLAWLIARNDWLTFSHASIPALATAGTPITFRLVPDSDWVKGDTADLYEPGTLNDGLTLETVVTLQDVHAPRIQFVSFTQNGIAVDFGNHYDVADAFVATVCVEDPQGGPLDGELTLDLGGLARTWAIPTLENTVRGLRAIPISALGIGDWRIGVTVRNASGRTVKAIWPFGAEMALLHIRSSVVTDVVPPVASPPGGIFASFPQRVTLTCSTVGASIRYWVVALGRVSAGIGTVYAEPLTIWTNQTLWAQSVVAAGTNILQSQLISYDFTPPTRGGRYQLP